MSATKSSRFRLGPLAHEHFMGQALWKSGVNSGPCRFPFHIGNGFRAHLVEGHTSQNYLDSLARSSLLQIRSRAGEGTTAVNSRPFSFPIKPISHLSDNAVSRMLTTVCAITPHLVPRSADQCLPLLWHPDLHDGECFYF